MPGSESRRRAAIAALAGTTIWGVSYSITKRTLAEVDPLAVAFARAVGATPFFCLLLLARQGRAAFSWPALRRAAPLGLLGIFLNQILFITGLSRTTASHSALLFATIPVFVLLIAVLGRQESLTVARGAGLLMAFGGVAVVALEKGFDLRQELVGGDLITLGGALSFAAYTVAGKPVLRELGPLRTTALAYVVGGGAIAIVTAPAAAAQRWTAVSAPALLGLAYAVIFGTMISYLLYYFALARLDPSQTAAFTYIQPVIAALVAWLFAGESLTPAFLLGGAMVLGGVLLAERA
jgi:drug/metabolite transporter (DMT)-like permease